MSRESVNRLCAALPGAERSDPWGGGHDAWKVGGKMFACIGANGNGVSVKTRGADVAELMIAALGARRAPYFHRSWVELPLDLPEGEMRHRIAESYALVRAGLPRAARERLPPAAG
jgi:predicted DNA-binding protein (MmcQ/YjbR family)